jgi:hypothetical protein
MCHSTAACGPKGVHTFAAHVEHIIYTCSNTPTATTFTPSGGGSLRIGPPQAWHIGT